MKKRLQFGSIILALMLILVACGGGETEEVTKTYEGETMAFGPIGLEIKIPNSWLDYNENFYTSVEADVEDADLAIIYQYLDNETKEQLLADLDDFTMTHDEIKLYLDEEGRVVKDIAAVTVSSLEEYDMENIRESLGFEHIEESLINEEEDIAYFYLWNDADDSDMDESSKEGYQAVMEAAPLIGSSFTVLDPETMHPESPEETESVGDVGGLKDVTNWTFESSDLDGNVVDDSIFADYDLTLVNVWGTFCGPCKVEIPELVQLHEEYGDRVGFLGIISDVYEENDANVDVAKQIIEELNVDYVNIKLNERIHDTITKHVMGIPTTFFVDSEGNVVGEIIVGAQAKDVFEQQILDLLEP